MVLPLLQQTIGVGLRHDQDVCVARLAGICGAQQLKAGAGIAGRCTHAAHGGQEDLDVCGAGLVGQDDGGLGQVRHPGEWEAAVGIGCQIGHGQIVVKTREVDGGLWIDGRKQFGGWRRFAAAQVVGRYLERELQLVVATDHESRNLEVRTGLGSPVIE